MLEPLLLLVSLLSHPPMSKAQAHGAADRRRDSEAVESELREERCSALGLVLGRDVRSAIEREARRNVDARVVLAVHRRSLEVVAAARRHDLRAGHVAQAPAVGVVQGPVLALVARRGESDFEGLGRPTTISPPSAAPFTEKALCEA
jgi:hypothetical protein